MLQCVDAAVGGGVEREIAAVAFNEHVHVVVVVTGSRCNERGLAAVGKGANGLHRPAQAGRLSPFRS